MYTLFGIFKEIFTRLRLIRISRMVAALSFYGFFALTPLLVVLISLADVLFGRGLLRIHLINQIQSVVGIDQKLLWGDINKYMPDLFALPMLSKILVLLTVIIGASALFVQLKDMINSLWSIEEAQRLSISTMLHNRFIGVLMILSIGLIFLLMVLASALFAILNGALPSLFILFDYLGLVHAFDVVLSVLLSGILCSLIYKYLPDARVGWHESIVGGSIAALLLTFTKTLLAWYFSFGALSFYGGFSSVLVVMIWIYASAYVVLFGAQFVYVYSRLHGQPIKPIREK